MGRGCGRQSSYWWRRRCPRPAARPRPSARWTTRFPARRQSVRSPAPASRAPQPLSYAPHQTDPISHRADVRRRQQRIAEVAELIHVASLLHDDVLDNATTRRASAPLPAPTSTRRGRPSDLPAHPAARGTTYPQSRRGLRALNIEVGNKLAILAGDFLLARASVRRVPTPRGPAWCHPPPGAARIARCPDSPEPRRAPASLLF